MSGTVSLWPQLPGFTFRNPAPTTVAPPARPAYEAPAVKEGVRAKLEDALYRNFYANAMAPEDYAAKTRDMSDKQIADAAYDAFYKGKLDRDKFNDAVGLTSASGATADAITRGMSFGFMDEISAAADTLGRTVATVASGKMPTFERIGNAYSQTLRAQRENADVFRQNNPYLGRGLEFAGGVITGASPGAVATAAPTATQSVLNAGKIGAIAGFGDTDGTIADRVVGSGIGAGMGLGIGAAVPLVSQGVALTLGKVGRALGFGDSEKVASQMLLKAFRDDGIPPDQIAAKLAEWQKAGAKPEALFDLGGANVRRLARTAAGRTGPGTEKAVTFLDERQADQARRIVSDVQAKLGQSADDFHASIKNLLQKRATEAAPKYEAAFSRIVPTADEYGRVARFVRDPIGQEALQKGLRIVELEHLARGDTFRPSMYGVVKGDDGRWIIAPNTVPNLRFMDAVKRGYDEIVEGFRDSTTGRLQLNQYGRAVNDARAAYVADLRDMFPRYGSALDAWAGPSQLIDATNRGRNIFSMKDSDVAAAAVAVRNNPAEADAFRLGAAQAMRDQIARAPDGADAVKRIFGSPTKRELLRAAFPNAKAFAEFELLMKREAAMFKNSQFVHPDKGSQTQPRQSDAANFGADATGIIGDMAVSAILPGQSVGAAFSRGARDLLARGQGVTPGVADALVGRMFTADPAAIRGTVGLLGDVEIQNAIRQLQANRLRGLFSSGVTAGGVVAR